MSVAQFKSSFMNFIEMAGLKTKLASIFNINNAEGVSPLTGKRHAIFLPLVPSPKTGKKFIAIVEHEATWNPSTPDVPAEFTHQHDVLKVEQAIDFRMPTKFMYENDAIFLEGCVVNVDESKQVKPIHVW